MPATCQKEYKGQDLGFHISKDQDHVFSGKHQCTCISSIASATVDGSKQALGSDWKRKRKRKKWQRAVESLFNFMWFVGRYGLYGWMDGWLPCGWKSLSEWEVRCPSQSTRLPRQNQWAPNLLGFHLWYWDPLNPWGVKHMPYEYHMLLIEHFSSWLIEHDYVMKGSLHYTC